MSYFNYKQKKKQATKFQQIHEPPTANESELKSVYMPAYILFYQLFLDKIQLSRLVHFI